MLAIFLTLLQLLFLAGLALLTWNVWRSAAAWRSLFALAAFTWLVGVVSVAVALQTMDATWLAQTHRTFSFELKTRGGVALDRHHTLIAPPVAERLPVAFDRLTHAVQMQFGFQLQPDGTVGNVDPISPTSASDPLVAEASKAIHNWRFGPIPSNYPASKLETAKVRIANRYSGLLPIPVLCAFSLIYLALWYLAILLTPEHAASSVRTAGSTVVNLRRMTLVIGFLMGVGWLLIYRLAPATSQFSLPANLALWMLLGGIAFLVTMHLMRCTDQVGDLIQRVGPGWVVIGAALLIYTHFFGVGHGSDIKLWLRLPGPLRFLEFETVELVKLMMVFYVTSVAYIKSRAGRNEVHNGAVQVRLAHPVERYQGLVVSFCLVFCALILMSDFGPLLLLFLLLIVLFHIQGFPKWALGGVGVLALLLVSAYAIGVPSRWHERVESWRNPWVSAQGDPTSLQQGREHAAHAQWAISSGGVLGSGLGRGMPNDVQEIVSDFVFTAIAEELGWIGCLALVALLAYLVTASLHLAQQRNDAAGRLLIAGLGALFGLQSLLIMGGNVGLWPLTGITLPLLSYGGTSLFINCFAFGLLLGTAARPGLLSPALLGASQHESDRCVTLLRVAVFPALFLMLAAKLTAMQAPFSPWRTVALVHVRADKSTTTNPRFAAKAPPIRRVTRGSILDNNENVIAETVEGNRTLHQPELFSPLVGIASMSGQTVGLEGYLGDILRGRLSVIGQPQVDSKGTRGFDVVLTLDSRLQKFAYDLLSQNGYSGSIVGIVPQTGEIRFAVSRSEETPAPTTVAAWQASYANHAGAYPFCYRRPYAPGSTFKTLDAAAALENHLPENETSYTCTGEFDLPNSRPIHDFERRLDPQFAGHGLSDLTRALTYSCNSAYAHLGVQLGWNRLYDYAERAGFDSALPLLPESLRGRRKTWLETEPSVLTANAELPENLSMEERAPIFLAQTALGQRNTRMTALHLALWTAAIANGGNLMEPTLAERIQERSQSPVWTHTPRPLRRAMSEETAAQLRSMMLEVVEHGTGRNAKMSDLSIAGKTGSPQEDSGETNALFIGFAPVENPQMAVVVIVEGGKTGGSVAAPLAARMLQAACRK